MAGAGLLNAWVDYTAATTTLAVYVSQTETKPATPLVTTNTVNVFTTLGANWYVGFAASTGLATATPPEINQHDIYELEWSTDGVPCTCEGDLACTSYPTTPACGSAGLCAVCSATNHTACTGATPVCNTATQTCVGCLSNANCSGATPICDAASLTCRPCNSNADCGGTTYCDTVAGSVNLGTCVTCVADANCPPATPRCNPATNTCIQCLSSADCGGTTPSCQSGTCKSCASDADCNGATPACEVSGSVRPVLLDEHDALHGHVRGLRLPDGDVRRLRLQLELRRDLAHVRHDHALVRAVRERQRLHRQPGGPGVRDLGPEGGILRRLHNGRRLHEPRRAALRHGVEPVRAVPRMVRLHRAHARVRPERAVRRLRVEQRLHGGHAGL